MSTKTVQDSSLTAVANAIRAKTGGTSALSFPTGFVSAIGGLPSETWVRPSEWPDLDNIVLPDYLCVYLTYDLSKVSNPDYRFISAYFRGDDNSNENCIAERGHIDPNHNFVVDATYQGTDGGFNTWALFRELNTNDGTVQLWRLRNASNSATEFGFRGISRAQDSTAFFQPCVEILFNDRGTVAFKKYGNGGYAKTDHLENVTICGSNSASSCYQAWNSALSLRKFTIKNGTSGSRTMSDARNMLNNSWKLLSVDFGNTVFPTTGTGAFNLVVNNGLKRLTLPTCGAAGTPNNVVGSCYTLEYLDMRNMDVSGVTTLPNGFIQNLPLLRELNMNGLDFSADTKTDTFDMTGALPNLIEFYPPKVYRSQKWNQNTLSHDSLVRIVNVLPTVTSQTLTIGTYNQSKLTAAEIAIATEKGWTVA